MSLACACGVSNCLHVAGGLGPVRDVANPPPGLGCVREPAREMTPERLAEVRAWATGVSWTDEPPVEDLRRMATLADEAQKRLSTLTEAVAWYLELRARHAGSNGAHAEGYANAMRAAHDDLTSLVDGEPATAQAAHLEALTARLEAAERERDRAKAMNGWDEWKRVALETVDAITEKRDAEKARADAAEAKLAALAEAAKPGGAWHVRLWDAINAYAATTTSRASVARQKAVVAIEDALRSARGEP